MSNEEQRIDNANGWGWRAQDELKLLLDFAWFVRLHPERDVWLKMGEAIGPSLSRFAREFAESRRPR